MTSKNITILRSRLSGNRTSKLIIIAAEGTKTEKIYFEDMASAEYYRNQGVHIEILERDTKASSPKHILSCIDGFKKKYGLQLNKDDELWMVIDKDKWTLGELSLVASECKKKCYLLAVSNPCFEFWLLLHVKSLDDYSNSEKAAIAKNTHVSSKKTFLEKELTKVLGSYNKGNPDTSKFLPVVDVAISRAKVLDTKPTDRWPNGLGTRVYRLAISIKNI